MWVSALVLFACSRDVPEPPKSSVTERSAPVAKPDAPRSGDADVQRVRAVQGADGTWTFHVTVLHADQGWTDYADGWDVVLPDGTVVRPDPTQPYTRLLRHPHVGEQPFTRTQPGIVIPDSVVSVTVRAHDGVSGWGGMEVMVDLTASSGSGFAVER